MEALVKQHKSIQEIEREHKQVVLAQKDSANFEVLYNEYHEQIFRFVYHRLESKEQAFDITSQVFMKALSNLSSYKFKGVPFSAWLYRIALNELATFFKKNQSARTIDIDTVQLQNLANEIDEESLDDLYNKTIEAIGKLSEHEVLLIEMRYFENKPFKEIGDILSITENNAKVKVYRIVEKLQKLLK